MPSGSRVVTCGVTAAALVVAGFLAVPGTAGAEVDANSVTTQAEIEALATDGLFDDQARKTRAGFTGFQKTVTAEVSGHVQTAGAGGRAEVLQDSETVEDGNEFLGVDTRGTADASFEWPNSNFGFPQGDGTSDLEVGFDVTDAPVQFSLTGTMEVSMTSDNGVASARVLGLEQPDVVVVTQSDGTISESIDLTGTLDPGSHTFRVDLQTHATFATGFAAGGSATAQYDLKLRFCTITVQAGVTNGTEGDDVICGTQDADTIFGNGGNDRIFGLGGDDTIEGGSGGDDIDGDDGDDVRLYGGPGSDVIDGGPGNDGDATSDTDVVAGGPGDDEIDGGPGNDSLFGRCGEDLNGTPSPVCPADPPAPGEDDVDGINGGPGNDRIFGDLGANTIRGGDGDDSAIIGEGGGTIDLGKGDDNALGSEFRDEIDGGPGNDGQLPGLIGGGAADTITGGPGDDILEGEEGNDDLFGEGGSDKLAGGKGNDCLVGGSRKDDLEAGAGDDTIIAKDGGRDAGSGGPGPDEGRFDPQDAIVSVAVRNFQGGC